MPQQQLGGAAPRLPFGAAYGCFYLVAAATVSLAEQDAVEPQVSKGKCWGGTSAACGPTTHILPSISMRFYATGEDMPFAFCLIA